MDPRTPGIRQSPGVSRSAAPTYQGSAAAPASRAARTPEPNRPTAWSTARSASRQPRSRSPSSQLPGRAPGRGDALDPDADQPDPRPVELEAVVERAGGRVDLRAGVGRGRQGPGPGDRAEVGEAHLELTVRPACPDARSRAAVFSASRSSSRWITPWSSTSTSNVSSAPIERSGSSGTTARGSCPLASACRWPATPSPSARASAGSGSAARSPTVRRPRAAQVARGALADAPQRPDRQRLQERPNAVGRHDEQPVRLASRRRELGHELRRGHPDRAGDALLVGDPGADPLADLSRAGRAGGARRTRRGTPRPATAAPPAASPTGNRHHPGRGRGVPRHVGRDDHRLRAQPERPAHRHRAAHPERPGLVRRGQHHPAPPAADDHRSAAQLRPAPQLRRWRRRRPCRRAGSGSRCRRRAARPAARSGPAPGCDPRRPQRRGQQVQLRGHDPGTATGRRRRPPAPAAPRSLRAGPPAAAPGTRSATTPTPCTASTRSPAAATSSPSSVASNRRSIGSAWPRPSVRVGGQPDRVGQPAAECPREHRRRPAGGQHAGAAAGAQGAGHCGQRLGRRVDHLEQPVAEHQVVRAQGDRRGQPLHLALQRGRPARPHRPPRPAGAAWPARRR